MSCRTCRLATLMSLRQGGLLSLLDSWMTRHVSRLDTRFSSYIPVHGVEFFSRNSRMVMWIFFFFLKSVTRTSIALVLSRKMGEISVLDELSLEALFCGVTSRWATTERRISAWCCHFANNEMLYKCDTNTLLRLYNILVISRSKLCVFAPQI